jgi:hypothetical protein
VTGVVATIGGRFADEAADAEPAHAPESVQD